VVIIEAAEKSGALITARRAAEQGRPVFAVPGPLDSSLSAGPHDLIRQGAILIRGLDDMLEELGGSAKAVQEADQPAPPGMDDVQRRLWEFLSQSPRHIDEMVQQLGIAVPQAASALLMLEMKKAVRRLPGNQYERR
jgi:DNA processing protein